MRILPFFLEYSMNSANLTLKPVPKKQAMAIFEELVTQGLNPTQLRYCTGNFTWHGTAKHYHDRECPVSDNVKAVWVERRQDADGPYAVFMCVAAY